MSESERNFRIILTSQLPSCPYTVIYASGEAMRHNRLRGLVVGALLMLRALFGFSVPAAGASTDDSAGSSETYVSLAETADERPNSLSGR